MAIKNEKGVCKKCTDGIERLIVNKTHQLCTKHNRERLNGQGQTLALKKPLKNTPINKVSDSLKIGLRKYEETKAKKRAHMITGGFFKCFFTNQPMNIAGNESWHHALGRDGPLLYDYRNIFPVLDAPHREYHDLTMKKLMKTYWYPEFIKRVKTMNANVYNKEIERMLKAKVISMESFLNEYK